MKTKAYPRIKRHWLSSVLKQTVEMWKVVSII